MLNSRWSLDRNLLNWSFIAQGSDLGKTKTKTKCFPRGRCWKIVAALQNNAHPKCFLMTSLTFEKKTKKIEISVFHWVIWNFLFVIFYSSKFSGKNRYYFYREVWGKQKHPRKINFTKVAVGAPLPIMWENWEVHWFRPPCTRRKNVSLKPPGTGYGRSKQPPFCLCRLSVSPVSIRAPEHTDWNTKIKPRDFLGCPQGSETKLPCEIAYLNKLNSCVLF